jgi:ABC-2 type transport system permease protein
MRNTLIIAQRQFRSYFNGPVAYIVLCLMLFALGVLFWPSFFIKGRATVRDMSDMLAIILLFGAPAMTMGLIAEENRTGTIELLATMPIKDWEIIVGKFAGVLGLYGVLLLFTLVYPFSVSSLGNLDWGPVAGGYLGLLFQGATLLALGLMASSWTDNQLVAFFVALTIGGLLFLADRFTVFLPTALGQLFDWISIDSHRRSMARGVIDTRDLMYFVSLTLLALMISFRSLEGRRWR